MLEITANLAKIVLISAIIPKHGEARNCTILGCMLVCDGVGLYYA